MARRDELLGVTGADTIIGSGVRLKGTVIGEGDITIDGRLVGDIKAQGNVSIGVNAIIKANVKAVNVSVAGKLTGDILAEGEVSVAETAHVTGDITCIALSIAPGAVFVGRSQMEVPRVGEVEAPDISPEE